jgi:AraC-like DNA-binding protein
MAKIKVVPSSILLSLMPAVLPRLPFGESVAATSSDVDGLLASQKVTHRAVRWYEPIGSRREFRQRSVTVAMDGLRLVASAHTPVAVEVGETDDVALIVPFAGWSTAVIKGHEYRWRSGESAMFLPQVARLGTSSVRATVGISYDPERLKGVALSLAAAGSEAMVAAALSRPRLVPLARRGFSFAAAFRRILSLVDDCLQQPDTLSLLGVDDMLYRTAALLLLPEEAIDSGGAVQGGGLTGPVDRACDYIRGHLGEPIRLADLEAVSGLKPRSLQIAFQRRHGCSAREWIRDQRLEAARRLLSGIGRPRSVTAVALQCGFTRLATFSRAYATHFGERPSDTLRRAGHSVSAGS